MEYSFGCREILLVFLAALVSSPQTGASSTSNSKLSCHPVLTVNVTGELTGDGGLQAVGYHFSEGHYQRINGTHFRVCICEVTKCLRKCCMKDESMLKNACVKRADSYPVRPEVYDKDLRLLYNYDITRFVTVHGDTCKSGKYPLNPKIEITDTYFFIVDGILYTQYDGNKYNTEHFCFEHRLSTPDQIPGPSSLTPFICFTDSVTELKPFVPIGMIISTPFLLATFLVYLLPELRNLHGKNLMSHVGSLFVAYVVLISVQMASQSLSPLVCVILGYTIQYAFLASFFWLNVMCFDIWWTFSGYSSFKGDRKSAELKKYCLYSIYAWGAPAIISAVTLIMQFVPGIPKKYLKPDIGTSKCFLVDPKAVLAYFYGPIAAIFVCDIILFVFTAIKINLVRKETVAVFRGKDSRHSKESSKQRYFLYLKLFLIMGVIWMAEVISWAVKEPTWIWYITDIANSLQGLLVFITCICTRRVRRLLIARFCPKLKPKDADTTTSTTRYSVSRTSSDASGFHMRSTVE